MDHIGLELTEICFPLPSKHQNWNLTSGIIGGHLLVIGTSHEDVRLVGEAQHCRLAPGDTRHTRLGDGLGRALPTQAPCPGPLTLDLAKLLPISCHVPQLHSAVPRAGAHTVVLCC